MRVVGAITLGVFGVLLLTTLVASEAGVPTVSMTIRDFAYRANIIPFIFGALMSHWFFPRKRIAIHGLVWLFGLCGLIGAYDLTWYLLDLPTLHIVRFPFWSVLVGMPCGVFLWPQSRGLF